jgi:hypothetical protein
VNQFSYVLVQCTIWKAINVYSILAAGVTPSPASWRRGAPRAASPRAAGALGARWVWSTTGSITKRSRSTWSKVSMKYYWQQGSRSTWCQVSMVTIGSITKGVGTLVQGEYGAPLTASPSGAKTPGARWVWQQHQEEQGHLGQDEYGAPLATLPKGAGACGARWVWSTTGNITNGSRGTVCEVSIDHHRQHHQRELGHLGQVSMEHHWQH